MQSTQHTREATPLEAAFITATVDNLVHLLTDRGYDPALFTAIVQWAEDCLDMADDDMLPLITADSLLEEWHDWTANA